LISGHITSSKKNIKIRRNSEKKKRKNKQINSYKLNFQLLL